MPRARAPGRCSTIAPSGSNWRGSGPSQVCRARQDALGERQDALYVEPLDFGRMAGHAQQRELLAPLLRVTVYLFPSALSSWSVVPWPRVWPSSP